MTFETAANPAAAIDRLEHLYGEARAALRRDLQRFFDTGQAPTPGERAAYRYPLLRVTYEPSQLPAATRRGYAKFAAPGVYSTTITQPAEFRAYLLDQLQPLVVALTLVRLGVRDGVAGERRAEVQLGSLEIDVLVHRPLASCRHLVGGRQHPAAAAGVEQVETCSSSPSMI